MRTPTEEIKFPGYTNEQGEELWLKIPRSVREATLREMSEAPKTDAGRTANLILFGLVTAWNLDDDEGKPLPLVRTISLSDYRDQTEADRPDGDMEWSPRTAKEQWQAAREAVISQVPTEIITETAKRTLRRGADVSDRAEGF